MHAGLRVYITGVRGQLGRALTEELSHCTVSGCDLPDLDITDRSAIHSSIQRWMPDVVIHAAAWTDVDGCARDPDQAFRTNGLGTQNVVLACAEANAAMVYVSTNEVFDGAATEPYGEWDPLHPINPYGTSKAAGEWFVRHLLTRFYITRTAWLFSQGGRNFPHKMVELATEVRDGQLDALRVVDDEVGNPTYAPDLASAIVRLVTSGAYGVYHFVSEGYCSRYDLAREVLDLAGLGNVAIEPIRLAQYKRSSTPPAFAPLANTAGAALGIRLPHWKDAMARLMEQSH